MKNKFYLLLLIALWSCKQNQTKERAIDNTANRISNSNFTIAFGSCNNQNLPNDLWDDVLLNNPDVWVWGGDIIYADTENMGLMRSYYDQVKNDKNYKEVVSKMDVLGTWDDHDYGQNDAGIEYVKKDSAQQLFLDFIDVDKKNERRNQNGIYHSKTYKVDSNSVKIILLDTRYFRTPLTKDPSGKKRYLPAKDTLGSILGAEQWNWLSNELITSTADFNILVSSIQFLSAEHGFETWGNMPNEVKKLKKSIVSSKAKNVIILSGDRHISEISKTEIEGLTYPLYDFTSSGLTHTYTSFTGEPNKYRVSDVIKDKSFGLLRLDLSTNEVLMEIRGDDNVVLEQVIHKY